MFGIAAVQHPGTSVHIVGVDIKSEHIDEAITLIRVMSVIMRVIRSSACL